MRRVRARSGLALIAVLACMAVIEVAVLGLLLICADGAASARDGADQLRARTGAESAVRAAAAAWDRRVAGGLAPGGRMPVPAASGVQAGGVIHEAETWRLAGDAWLLVGRARVERGGRLRATAFAQALLRAFPVDSLWPELMAAVVSNGLVQLDPGAVVSGANTALSPTCPAAASQPPVPGVSLGPSGTVSGGGTVGGVPPVLAGAAGADSAAFEALAGVPWSELVRIADRLESGAVTAGPVAAGGTCDTAAAGNWGAPADSTHPCADYAPLIVAAGDLRFGGVGQGILAVHGDLAIDPGAAFTGAVLVRGRLDAADAQIHGAVRAGGGIRTEGFIQYDPCALTSVFAASPALRKLYRFSPRWWLAGPG